MLDRIIPAACQVNDGRRGFCNLCVSKTDDEITLDPRVAGCCVISLEETEAKRLRNILAEWLSEWTTPRISSDTPWSATHRTIPATCHTHRGCQGFCNLRVRKSHDEITLDPHVTASSVISLNEDGALAMRDTLAEWLDA